MAEAYSPFILVRGKMSTKAIISSVTGSAQAMNDAKLPTNGDLLNTLVKAACSDNLLTPVYTNSRINKAAMISIIVARFIVNKVDSWSCSVRCIL